MLHLVSQPGSPQLHGKANADDLQWLDEHLAEAQKMEGQSKISDALKVCRELFYEKR